MYIPPPAKREDLISFESKARMFAHYGRNTSKSLDIVTAPLDKTVWFIVTNHRLDVYTGPDLDKAIAIYNKSK